MELFDLMMMMVYRLQFVVELGFVVVGLQLELELGMVAVEEIEVGGIVVEVVGGKPLVVEWVKAWALA